MNRSIVWIGLMAWCGAWCGASAETGQLATLLEPVVLQDAGGGDPLPRVSPPARLACFGRTKDGFHVAVHDGTDRVRYGLLPFRDAWGRVSARDWTNHLELPPHVVEIVLPIDLQAEPVVVPAGFQAELVSDAGEKVQMRWRCNGLDVSFAAPHDAVVLVAPDAPGQRERVVQALEASVAREQERHEKLASELETLDIHIGRVGALMHDMTELALANAELEAKHSMATEVSDTLEGMVPTTAEAREQGVEAVREAVGKQATMSSQEAQFTQERALLEEVRRHLLDARVELGELQLRVAVAKAQRDALQGAGTASSDVDKVLRESAALHQRLVRGVSRDAFRNDTAQALVGLLDTLQQANDQLIAELQASREMQQVREEELQSISARIQMIQEALNPKPVPPAPSPEPTPQPPPQPTLQPPSRPPLQPPPLPTPVAARPAPESPQPEPQPAPEK